MALSVNGGFGSKGGGSNPNLLDNGWFTVNQRGATSYSGVGYTVDRWSKTVDGIVTVNDGYISLTKGSYTYCNIMQGIENGLPVGIYTGSILFADGTIFKGTITLTESTTNLQYFFRELNDTFRMYYIPASKYFVIACLNDSKPDIKAVKLERGSVSTLALDSAPNYTTELLKCQRYFERIYGHRIGGGHVDTENNYVNFHVPYRVDKRITSPTVSFSDTSVTLVAIGHSNVSATNVDASSTNGHGTYINTKITTSINASYTYRFSGTFYVDISADL